ncbi:MAG TPA: hypothetical protein VGP43_03690 [Chitinophagaceae bacterium]|nr:hypothetical protein [Chitinophagaceae bacterium]
MILQAFNVSTEVKYIAIALIAFLLGVLIGILIGNDIRKKWR